MLRSTRQSEQRRAAAAATGSTTEAAPEPERFDDGTFRLPRSDGRAIPGSCRDPSLRLSRRPITYPPNAWYADCNQIDSPHTLRIYRLGGDDAPKDVHHYSYDPQSAKWKVITPKPKRRQLKRHVQSGTPSPPSKSAHILISLLVLIRPLFRWLLSPIADPKWQTKMAKRQLCLELTPIETHLMNEEGFLRVIGDELKSVQLRHDGTVRVGDRLLRPRHAGTVINIRDKFSGEEAPWVQWYGDILIIKEEGGSDVVLTYELEHWQQWAVIQPNFGEIVCRDLNATRRIGARFLERSFSFSWRGAVVVVILAFLCSILWDIYNAR